MWTKTVEEDLSTSSVSYEAIFFFMSPRQKKAAKEIPFIFFRGENTLTLDWPLPEIAVA